MLSIVVPCYNEQASLPLFYDKVSDIVKELGEEYEFIFVDDGSKDNTLKIIQELSENDPSVKYISFSRNFGKEAAIYAGLSSASGEYTVLIDADLQDPPELIPEMLASVKSGEYDCAATRRVSRRGEPVIRSFFSRMFYKLINRLCEVEIADGARDFRLMNRQYVDAILSLSERCRFSKGIFGWIGFKTRWLEFENRERIAGETKWSFFKLFAYAVEGLTAFTTGPLVLSTVIGCVLVLVFLVLLVVIVVRRIVWGDPVAGWASTICVIVFIGSIQLLSVGILGQYMAKSYTEIKNRPIYICKKTNIKCNKNDKTL